MLEFKGFRARIMEAERLVGESLHALPPGNPLPVYQVDQFSKHPDSWMTGAGNFVVPVNANKGLWFDWTMNDDQNTAILPSVKGANPITGLPTSGFELTQYDKCPIHDIEFTGNKFCEKCGYKWPSQNYVTAPNKLWWDGFRADDGSVRQFFFTEDLVRDMPSQLVGEENTVPAFGFAFYSPKKRRVREQNARSHTSGMSKLSKSPTPTTFGGTSLYELEQMSKGATNSVVTKGSGSLGGDVLYSSNVVTYSCDEIPTLSMEQAQQKYGDKLGMASFADDAMHMDMGLNLTRGIDVTPKEVSVGAGAKINQVLAPDRDPVDVWREEPDAVMRIYFVFQDEFEKWKAESGGLKSLDAQTDGMMAGKIVG